MNISTTGRKLNNAVYLGTGGTVELPQPVRDLLWDLADLHDPNSDTPVTISVPDSLGDTVRGVLDSVN